MNKKGEAAKTGKKAGKGMPKGGATPNGARKIAKRLEKSAKLGWPFGGRKK
ncbi:MAG TPA: hypothetical protein VIV12_02100 [Streptosporangiaceae bacterium]